MEFNFDSIATESTLDNLNERINEFNSRTKFGVSDCNIEKLSNTKVKEIIREHTYTNSTRLLLKYDFDKEYCGTVFFDKKTKLLAGWYILRHIKEAYLYTESANFAPPQITNFDEEIFAYAMKHDKLNAFLRDPRDKASEFIKRLNFILIKKSRKTEFYVTKALRDSVAKNASESFSDISDYGIPKKSSNYGITESYAKEKEKSIEKARARARDNLKAIQLGDAKKIIAWYIKNSSKKLSKKSDGSFKKLVDKYNTAIQKTTTMNVSGYPVAVVTKANSTQVQGIIVIFEEGGTKFLSAMALSKILNKKTATESVDYLPPYLDTLIESVFLDNQ